MPALQLHDTERMPRLIKTTTRILVIDDDASVSTAIQAILARRHYETVLAPRAHAGIHAFQASQFDVVMVDCSCPE
jgi:DNA-binding response OmpR family regulator